MEGFLLSLKFDTGETGVFDMDPYLGFQCYHRLRNFAYFCQVKPERGTAVWPNDEDMAPKVLWEGKR